MDVYNGPVGSASVSQQIHDYNPHITPNGVFWTILIPPDSVEVHLGAGQASFRLSTTVFDDHDLKSSLGVSPFPPGFPQSAEVSFDVEWSDILEQQHIRNEDMNFEGDFLHTGSTIQWSARDLSSGFEFVSEAPNPARAFYGVIGRERNGVFFE
jgi:hypothetical protein